MYNLSKISETLDELMFENNLTGKALALKIGIPAPTITRYRKGVHVPTVKNLVLIADFFQCSTDFLLGSENYIPNLAYKSCPPFPE